MSQEEYSYILTQSTEEFIEPYINTLTFVIDIAAGLIISISAIVAFFSFLKIYASQQKNRLWIKKQ
jgi:hypothetical protein